jgi:exodeoxyribonuclease VII large subunit
MQGMNFGSAPTDATAIGGGPLTVTQFNAIARQQIERNLPLLWIVGEISNFTRAPSGHCYFSLKDERAQVRCVMFRSRLQNLEFAPGNGMQVEVRAVPTLYEARGEFQLGVENMRKAGLGALFEKFARLKTKLEAEGIFASERKRPVPRLPRRIGVITSPAAAALRDVLTTLRRRMPSIPVIIYPTLVQGDSARTQIAAAIATAGARAECDVLILCRGGGSIEDLWAFNEESVARAMVASPIPIVSGVGHETDFTIADFVADARAPTPTGAAELVSPNRLELYSRARALKARLSRALKGSIEQRIQQADFLGRRLIHPGVRIADQLRHLGHLHNRLRSAWTNSADAAARPLARASYRLAAARPDLDRLRTEQTQLRSRLVRAARQTLDRELALVARLQANLHHLNPRQVLERGYAIVSAQNGEIVRGSAQLRVGDEVRLDFARGHADAKVSKTQD